MDLTVLDSLNGEITPELEAVGYVFKPVAWPLRGAYALMLLCFGCLVGFRLLEVQADKGTLFPYAIFPLAGVALTVWGSWRIWTRTWRRTYATERRPIDMAGRKRRVKLVTSIMLVAFAAVWVWQYSTGMLTSAWWVVFFAFIPYVPYVCLALGIRYETVPTKAALVVMARDRNVPKPTPEWQKRLEALWTLWPVRYAAGLLLLYVAYEIAQSTPMSKRDWIAVLCLFIWAMSIMKEVFAWLLGALIVLGIGSLIFGVMAALPVSVAIIIGAIIIARGSKQ